MHVIAHDGADGGEESAFAVASGSVEEEEGFFASAASEVVADGALEVLIEGVVVIGDLVEEGVPDRRGSVWVVLDRDEAGDKIVGIVWFEFASMEVEGAIGDVEQEGVSVELGG